MKLQLVKNIESYNKWLHVTILCMLIGSLMLTGLTILHTSATIRRLSNSIYIPVGGENYERAMARSNKENRDAEIRHQVAYFHELFFNLVPDHLQNRKNIEEKALYLADHSARNLYTTLMEQKFYLNLASSGSFQKIDIDSILVNYAHTPYTARLIGKLTITRPTMQSIRNLVTDCELVDLPIRTEKNPQALLIRKLVVIENRELKQHDLN
jgi:conjugative transposon TraK protein